MVCSEGPHMYVVYETLLTEYNQGRGPLKYLLSISLYTLNWNISFTSIDTHIHIHFQFHSTPLI